MATLISPDGAHPIPTWFFVSVVARQGDRFSPVLLTRDREWRADSSALGNLSARADPCGITDCTANSADFMRSLDGVRAESGRSPGGFRVDSALIRYQPAHS
jgi:hypothetical protein